MEASQVPESRVCRECGGDPKPICDFPIAHGSVRRRVCRSCLNGMKRDSYSDHNPDARRRSSYDRGDSGPMTSFETTLWRYKMTPEDYAVMLENQGGVCAGCSADKPGTGRSAFLVDHDHECCPRQGSCGRCVRGLLCHSCNVAAGLLGDSPRRMYQLAAYIARTKIGG